MDGKCAVQMLPRQRSRGGIELPDRVNDWFCDTGLVLASGVPYLVPGDVVVTDPYAGKKVLHFSNRDWQAGTQVRFYGCKGGADLDFRRGDPLNWCRPVPVHTQVLMKLTEDGWRPLEDWVWLEADTLQEKTGGGVYLPTAQQSRDCRATVHSVGPAVRDVKPGDVVIYGEGAVTSRVEVAETGAPVFPVREHHIYAVLT